MERVIRMSNYSIFLPSYSVGEECYKEIPYVTRKYGKKAVAIGGKTAMSKAKPELLKALAQLGFAGLSQDGVGILHRKLSAVLGLSVALLTLEHDI